MSSHQPHHLSFIGPLVIALAFIVLAYFFGAQRTMQFGLTAQVVFVQFLIALVAFGIIFALLFRSWPLTRSVISVLVIAFALVGAVEAYARIQEMVAVASDSTTQCEPNRYVARWWPYQNHAIVCSKDGTAWVGTE